MNRTILLGSAAIVLAAATVPVQAAHFHGWYAGVEGGANWVDDWDFISRTVGHTHFDTTNFDTGWAVLATVGYAFDHLRLEFEAGYRANDMESIVATGFTSNTFNFDGSLKEITLMANAHYDTPLTNKLMLSLGAGAGGDRVDADFNASFSNADFKVWRFAYQGIVGLSYAIGSRTDLTLNYRYLHVDALDLDFGPINGHVLNDTDDLVKHSVTIGLRFDLSADAEPEPPPMAAAAAPPLPPAHFVIFFGYNKCNITSGADTVLGEAAAAAQSMGSARVTIVGHTDTSGSAKYNQKLSECRARAAASNLEGKGVPRNAISASGRGEEELMVQTADGVKEPQNRRATVDLN